MPHLRTNCPAESSQSTELWEITNYAFEPQIWEIVYYIVKDRAGIHWFQPDLLNHTFLQELWEHRLVSSSLLLLGKALKKYEMTRRQQLGQDTHIWGEHPLPGGQWPIFRKVVAQLYSAFAFGRVAQSLPGLMCQLTWGPRLPLYHRRLLLQWCPDVGWHFRPSAPFAPKKDLSCGIYAQLPSFS